MELGIDIGGTSVKAAALDGKKLLWTGQSEFYSRPDTEALRAAIRQAVGGPVSQIDALGICAPGLFDASQGKITYAVNVPGVEGISLKQLVSEALGVVVGCETVICNDAFATALDVCLRRRNSGRLVVLTLGTGIGMSVLDEGRALAVEGESPGHIGQIDVSIPGHDIVGPDGGAGGLEGYLGVAALRKKYGEDVSAAVEKFTGEEPAMLALVRAIRIIHAIYRPNDVCLCGGIGIRLRHLLPTLRAKIETNLTNLARSGWTLATGEDIFHAARGAATIAAGGSRIAAKSARS